MSIELHPRHTMRQRTAGSRKSRTSSCDPIQRERPETSIALARAKPPPNRSTSDHGNFE